MMISIFALLRWVAALALACVAPLPARAQDYTRPKVRAITAFVRLDQARYTQQIDAALAVLRAAGSELAKEGYKVESLRIVTQPLGELVKGQSDRDALAFLRALDDLSVKEEFTPNIGPAMMRDSDDPHVMQLLREVLVELPNLNANAIVAADDGIHWKVIQESAALVRYVAEHTKFRQSGAFNFTATAMLQPYGPFYPG